MQKRKEWASPHSADGKSEMEAEGREEAPYIRAMTAKMRQRLPPIDSLTSLKEDMARSWRHPQHDSHIDVSADEYAKGPAV